MEKVFKSVFLTFDEKKAKYANFIIELQMYSNQNIQVNNSNFKLIKVQVF